MKEYLIGLDIGTSATKGCLLSGDGLLIARAQAQQVYQRGAKGEVSFDGEDFYDRVSGVIRELAAKVPQGGTVVGLSMASASGNTMLLDENGKPMTEAISWLDGRMTDECDRVFGILDPEEVREHCGWPYLACFPIAHLAWYKVHKPELLHKAWKICMSTDYLLYRMTGQMVMDYSTAVSFYLCEQKTGTWNQSYLDALSIREEQLPKLVQSGTPLGKLTVEAAEKTGLTTDCTVAVGAFDHHMGALGAGVTKEGQMLLSCGTSWVCLVPCMERKWIIGQKLLCDPFLSAKGGPYAGMFSVASVSLSISTILKRWISDQPDALKQFDALAKEAEPGACGLRIDPSRDCEKDYSGFEKKNIARALMEGTAFLLAREAHRLEQCGMTVSEVSMIGGPSRTEPWPQIVTDMLGKPVHTVYGESAGAVGAATVAGIASGLYGSLEEAYAGRKAEFIRRFPDEKNAAFYRSFSFDS